MLSLKLQDPASREDKNSQIMKWTGSEFEKASSEYHPPKKIKFPLGVSLIAACCAGDKEEFKRILKLGVDINTSNQDGMTCVHQCCINGDFDFLQFLIEEGADLNAQDNEGWTPLHAAASVGYEEIVRLLLKNGADVSLLSCETELPVDVSQDAAVTDLLNETMRARGIDPVVARQTEEMIMLNDAKHWKSCGKYEPVIDPRTGATPLHVAACKDYLEVLQLLLSIPGIDIDCQDTDGWTPLHAAAHWNREQSARLLVEAGASFDVYTYTSQSVFDVADKQIVLSLRQLRERQRSRKQNASPVSVPPPISAAAPPLATSESNPARTTTSEESETSSSEECASLASHAGKLAAGDVRVNGTVPPVVDVAKKKKNTERLQSDLEPSPIDQVAVKREFEKNPANSVAASSEVPVKRPSPPAVEKLKPPASNAIPAECVNGTTVMAPSDHVTSPVSKPLPQDRTPPPTPPRPAGPFTSILYTKPTTTVNSARIVTVRRPNTSSDAPGRGASPKPNEDGLNARRHSLLMSPAKSGETEAQRTAHARLVRNSRRSTQGVLNEELEEAKRLAAPINSSVPETSPPPPSQPPSTVLIKSDKPTVHITRSAHRPLASSTSRTTSSSGVDPLDSVGRSVNIGRAIDSLAMSVSSRSDAVNTSSAPTGSYTTRDKTSPNRKTSTTTMDSNAISDSRRPQRRSRRWNADDSSEVGKVASTDAMSSVLSNSNASTQSDRIISLDRESSKLDRIAISSPVTTDPDSASNVTSSPVRNNLPSVRGSDSFLKRAPVPSTDQSIDYRRLYESEKLQKERLMRDLDRITQANVKLRSQLAREQSRSDAPSSTSPQSSQAVNELQDRLKYLEDRVKENEQLREEIAKLRNENVALIHVISKLSEPT